MWDKITAFFLAIVLFFCNLFGIEYKGEIFTETENSYYYQDLAYGDHERQKLDLHIPKNSDGEVGLVLMIHGGAWVAGDKSGYTDYIKSWADKGYAAATINYRYLSYEVSFDDILDDVGNALKVIKETGAEHSVNINKCFYRVTQRADILQCFIPMQEENPRPLSPLQLQTIAGRQTCLTRISITKTQTTL